MTDLEDLWDDLPVGPAPVDRILRAGRAVAPASRVPARRPAPRWLRPLGSVGALAALGGAFLVGVQVAQGPTSPGDEPPAAGSGSGSGSGSGAEPAVFSGRLVAAGSCEALLQHYRDRGAEMVGPYGWEQGGGFDDLRTAVPVEESADAMSLSRAYGAAPVTQSATSSETGTNVQEAGVDEPDVVKTDGTTLWRVDGDVLTASDVSGEQVEQLAELDLGEAPGVEDLTGVEILLAGDTVVALGRVEEGVQERTLVLTIDGADPAAPAVQHVLDVDSGLVTARLHGDAVRLVTAAGLPDLPFSAPDSRGSSRSFTEAAEQNEALVRGTTIDDWLPTASLDGGEPRRLADCGEVAIPRSELGLDTVSVLGFDAAAADSLASLAEVDVTSLAAATTIAYASAEHLYLAAATPEWGWWGECWGDCAAPTSPPEAAGRTQLFDFALAGTGADYVGSGEVDGLVADRWALDEQDGVLRLAVGASSRTGNFNSVLTLRREGDELVEVGRLDRLGVNEQIESVRWFEGLAIVVTFRQIDPLYTVDLTDAEAPTLLGELKIPGFSEYLHPLGSRRLIGIGQGPVGPRGAWGAQAALFKVRDLTSPRRLDVVGYAPGTQALAGADPRQFTWLPEQRVALTVVARGSRGRTGWVSALRVEDGSMTNQMVVAEYGTDVDAVRLVPLPDGRVVLSTPSGGSFFAV
ncbi:beta-propeller domain-containing protein [Nocardioides nanhaiensis]|uniref:Benzoate transporter n=1 Tax=Nocardioides nanhaiensis TaxID=1476871 RepID=A0ABP8WA70_9ACTN